MEILSTKSPQEAGWVQIASEAMALSSALGDTKAALELNKLLLDRAATDSERFSLAMNLAETQYAMWLSKAPEARVNDVRQVVDAFEYAQKLINVNYAATGKISFLLKYAAFLGQQKDPEKALQIYNNCETILLANGASVSEAWLAKDNLFEFEMKCLVDLKRNDEAIVMLQRIASLPHTQIPVSQYVNRYASYVDPQSGAKFRAIISDWLVKHPSDKGTPALENSLAESFFNAQDYAEAATWYSKLLSEPIAQPTKDDLTSGRGGIASNILHNLAICLRQLGDKEQAESIAEFV